MTDDANELKEVAEATKTKNWDGAYETMQKLIALNEKRQKLWRELAQAIAIERQLQRVGVDRNDVDHFIRGDMIGATHNYKGQKWVRVCRECEADQPWRQRQPLDVEVCPICKTDMPSVQIRIMPSELRGKYARHFMGVELHNQKFVWFDEPIPPC